MKEQLTLQLVAPPLKVRESALRSLHLRSHAAADEARERDQRAQRQEDVLLQWFQVNQTARVTPSELHQAVSGGDWPLTSTRRALSNLTRRGLLAHYPGVRRVGPFGVKESCWSLA